MKKLVTVQSLHQESKHACSGYYGKQRYTYSFRSIKLKVASEKMEYFLDWGFVQFLRKCSKIEGMYNVVVVVVVDTMMVR